MNITDLGNEVSAYDQPWSSVQGVITDVSLAEAAIEEEEDQDDLHPFLYTDRLLPLDSIFTEDTSSVCDGLLEAIVEEEERR